MKPFYKTSLLVALERSCAKGDPGISRFGAIDRCPPRKKRIADAFRERLGVVTFSIVLTDPEVIIQ